MKGEQENKRARSRRENMARAIEHEVNGNMTAAYECYQKAVDVSPSVAYGLIQVLKQENVGYIVAPYEADAQMTFLAVSKQVDVVITEDSDLIAFGCPRVIYKMDKFGQGVEFRYSMLEKNKDLNLIGFTKQMILEMCILSGCDYLQSLPGMGLKKAHALMKKFKTFDQVIKHLKYNGIAISPLYEESFKKAILTFRHQRVYNPITEDLVHLSELADGVDKDLDFLGPFIPQHTAKGIATGELDPFTKMPFEGDSAGGANMRRGEAYQLNNFKLQVEKKKLDLPVQKNLMTNYFCFASLEAKRKFRLPRNSPKQAFTDFTTEANSCKNDNSTTGLESVDNGGATVASESLLLKCHGISEREHSKQDIGTGDDVQEKATYLSCAAFSGQHKSIRSQIKVRGEDGKVIVRSSYFLKKSTQLDNQFKENHVNDAATEKCGEVRGEDGKVMVRSSYFLKKSIQVDNQFEDNVDDAAIEKCGTSTSSLANRFGSDECEKKMRLLNKNFIMRSSYFQHKHLKRSAQYEDSNDYLVNGTVHSDTHLFGLDEAEGKSTIDEGKGIWSGHLHQNSVTRNSQDNKYEMLLEEDSLARDTEEDAVPQTTSFCTDIQEGPTKKRKAMMMDYVENEDARKNDGVTDTACPIQIELSSSTENTVPGGEGKFGCNIAHLGHYSEIAEKSMENFVSVISSFRFTSNGSRASGLRAPLRDIKNTPTNRSSGNMDISKFAYLPNKKASSARPRA